MFCLRTPEPVLDLRYIYSKTAVRYAPRDVTSIKYGESSVSAETYLYDIAYPTLLLCKTDRCKQLLGRKSETICEQYIYVRPERIQSIRFKLAIGTYAVKFP